MGLSVTSRTKDETKLKALLKRMLAEAFLEGERGDVAEKVAELSREVLQLAILCDEYRKVGRKKRYDVHVYVGQGGIAWQYFQVEK